MWFRRGPAAPPLEPTEAVPPPEWPVPDPTLAGPPPPLPGAPPPTGPPPGRWYDRELWPWLFVLLVLVIGGILAAYFLTRPSGHRHAATTVVVTSRASSASVSTATVPVVTVVKPTATGTTGATGATGAPKPTPASQVPVPHVVGLN